MKKNSALTLFEILVVLALLSIVGLPLYFSYTRTQANQALHASSEMLANTISRSRVFAREAREQKSWGVKRVDETTYNLVGVIGSNQMVETTFRVEPLVKITTDFSIFFNQGTGEMQNRASVTLENKYGRKIKIDVSKIGLIDTTIIQ